MEHNFDETKKSFKKYVEECREKIEKSFFPEESFKGIIGITSDMDYLAKRDKVVELRSSMIKTKLDHTMRMIDQIISINRSLDLKFDFDLVIKTAVLFHDIGRFSQAVNSNTFNDSIFYAENPNGFINHGYEGASVFMSEPFKVDERYKPGIAEAIKHHVVPEKYISSNLEQINRNNISKYNETINGIITGSSNLNEQEYLVFSLITQLVADIDKIDILYQCLNATFENGMLVRKHVFDSSMQSLDEISKYWGVPKKDIMDYNNIPTNKEYVPSKIRIPIQKMDDTKLKVPDDIKQMFEKNKWDDLPTLQKRRDWTFITIFWWRLGKFINDIKFSPVFVPIQEVKLITELGKKFEAMGNEIFDELGKPMGSRLYSFVSEAIDATYEIVLKKINNSDENLFVNNNSNNKIR